jgi:ribosomal protein L32
MGLPGHRRTSSHKRRRASHFALKPATLTVDKASGLAHLQHRAAPGATEYRGIAIHIKGRDRKLKKALAKTKSKTPKEKTPSDKPSA